MAFSRRFLHAVFLLALISGSCKKDKRVLDTAVQPSSDLSAGATVDELPVRLVTELHDSIRVFNSATKFFGSNLDPVFGRTDVGLYLTTHYSTSDIDFKSDSVVVDDAFLALSVNTGRFAGNRESVLSYSIFPLDSSLSRTRAYYSTDDRFHSQLPLSSVEFNGYRADSQTVQLPFDVSFATQMLRHPGIASNADLFRSAYKGFYLAAEAKTGEGAIYTCDVAHKKSGLFIVYRTQSTDLVPDTLRFNFAGDQAVRINTVRHDHSQAVPSLKAQLSGDTSAPQYVYMQGLGGTRIRVTIPVEKETSDSFNIAVNRAEFILPVATDFITDNYKVPPMLSLLPVGASGKDTLAQDQLNATDNARYGGAYSDGRYVFNIARHVQAINNGDKINRDFFIVVSNPDRALTVFRDEYFERAVLAGNGGNANRPKFVLSYTKVSVK